MNKILIITIISFSLFISIGNAQNVKLETQEQKEIAKEFKGTKFLQLDSVDVSNELKPISEEIKQNVIDTILLSKTHSQIFAQKRPDGYSSAYANFYSLDLKIAPIEKDDKNLELTLLYKNWISNSSDKELKVKINKFNVLNDLRFAVYEMLNGKNFVKENYNRIQRHNFNRIQTIRKIIDEKERKDSANLSKKKLNKEEDFQPVEEESEQVKLLRREREKLKNPNMNYSPLTEEENLKIKKSQANIPEDNAENKVPQIAVKSEKQKDEKIEMPDVDIKEEKQVKSKNQKRNKKPEKINPPIDNIEEEKKPDDVETESIDPPKQSQENKEWPSKSRITAFVNFYNEFNESTDLINTSTNLRYLGVGGEFRKKYYTDLNFGFSAKARLGLPLFHQQYKVPSNKLAKVNLFVSDVLFLPRIYLGTEYSTLYNVNVPTYGGGLRVYTSKLLWLQFGGDYTFNIKKRLFLIGYEYSKSFSSANDYNKALDVSRHTLTLWGQVYKRYGIGIVGNIANGNGDLTIKSQSVELSLTYDF